MSRAPQSSPARSRLPAYLLLLCGVAATPLGAQERRSALKETALLKAPNGVTLGTLAEGSEVVATRGQGIWQEVELAGWMVRGSLGADAREGYDVAVTAVGGENLRAGPNATILARLRQGTLLRTGETRTGWTRVTRVAWVAKAALAPVAVAAAAPKAATAESGGPPPAPGAAAAPSAGAPDSLGERLEMVQEAPLFVRPDGAEVGRLAPGSRARILARSGDWVRVGVEGWVRAGAGKAAGGPLAGVTAADVRAAPERFAGQVVEWAVQFIAVRTADELRPEMPPGQPYFLARGPLPESGFVYVMVPRDLLPQVRAFSPLKELTIRATVRAPRGKFLPTPVVELVSLEERP